MTWCLAAEQKLLHLADAFDRDAIPYAVLKGPALAHSVYSEPCLRPFGDLDLLVSSSNYYRAAALLARLGHRRRRPEPRPGWEARFGKASVHVRPDDGIEVDLHRTFVLGPFGQWIDGDELLANTDVFTLGGRCLPRLDDTGALLNVALHAVLGWATTRLVPVRDCVEVCAAGRVDGPRLARWARAWHLGAVLERARDLVPELLGVDVPRELRSLPVGMDGRSRRLLEAYGGSQREAGGLPLATIWAIRGIGAKAAYARALAFPSREFLASRAEGPHDASYRRRLARAAGWALPSQRSGHRSMERTDMS